MDTAFGKELNKLNCNGEINDKLLAQECLIGTEYIIDCVSNGFGKHVVCGIWVYNKFIKFPLKCLKVVLTPNNLWFKKCV